MQFRDLQKQYETYKAEIDAAVTETMKEASFIMGSKVSELEEKLAAYTGTKYCVTCANGTDALQLALMAWDIGPGDAVFVPDFTFFSTGEVVSTVGATPVFVDIDEHTFNMSPESLEKAIIHTGETTDLKPRVVIPVDLFGQPAEHAKIREIATRNDLLVLEDGAQGFGGKIKDKIACSFGDISTTSFFPAKPLGCYGDGGAVFTDNKEWYDLLRSYRVHGKGSDKYDNIRVGMNSRLDTIQAAILLVKMKYFEDEIKACRKAAEIYTELFKDNQNVVTPTILPDYLSSWAQYTILLDNAEERTRVMKKLKDNGIPSMIYYKKPMHLQKAFDPLAVHTDCPVTEQICDRCLSLPMGPFVTDEDIRLVTGLFDDFLSK